MIKTVAALSLLTAVEGVSYEKHSVLRCNPSTTTQLDALHQMDLNDDKVDFWREPVRKGGFVDIMVSNDNRDALEMEMKKLDVPCEEMIQDVQQMIDSQNKANSLKSDASYFESYHPPNEVFEYIDGLVSITLLDLFSNLRRMI